MPLKTLGYSLVHSSVPAACAGLLQVLGVTKAKCSWVVFSVVGRLPATLSECLDLSSDSSFLHAAGDGLIRGSLPPVGETLIKF